MDVEITYHHIKNTYENTYKNTYENTYEIHSEIHLEITYNGISHATAASGSYENNVFKHCYEIYIFFFLLLNRTVHMQS